MISLFTALASIHLSLSIKELNKTEPMNAFYLKQILIFQSFAYRQLEIHQVWLQTQLLSCGRQQQSKLSYALSLQLSITCVLW